MNVDDEDGFSLPEASELDLARERLVFNTTEDILLAMQDSGITYADLANRLGKSKAYISQLLNGGRNMTLRTLADISYALEVEVKVAILKNGRDVSLPLRQEHHKEFSKKVIGFTGNIPADPKSITPERFTHKVRIS